MAKVSTQLPTFPVSFNQKSKNMSSYCIADSDFGVSGYIDILLGADISSQEVGQGRWLALPGSPFVLHHTLQKGSVRDN